MWVRLTTEVLRNEALAVRVVDIRDDTVTDRSLPDVRGRIFSRRERDEYCYHDMDCGDRTDSKCA